MLLRSIALLCSVASIVRGLLIPSTFNGDVDLTLDSALAKSSLLKLDCPGCSFALNDGSKDYIKNSLVLNFSIDPSSPDVLLLNGVQLYPLSLFPQPLSALRIPSSVSLTALTSMLEDATEPNALPFTTALLNKYEVSITPSLPAVSGNVAEVLFLQFNILAVDGEFNDNLDSVELHILRTLDNTLYIASWTTKPPSMNSYVPSPNAQGKAAEAKECTKFHLLCKWNAIIGNKLSGMKSAMKGCYHKFHPSKFGAANSDSKNEPEHHGHPHHNGEEKHHGHKSPLGRHFRGLRKFFHGIKKIAGQVLVPILVGVVAGMSVSLLGMVVGTVVVFLWRRLYRGESQGFYFMLPSNEEEDEGRGTADTKDLPQYEEAVMGEKK